MNVDIGKTIRMSDIISAQDHRSLIVDTTMASVLGATKGLENIAEAISLVNESCDAIIVNPGTAEHHAPLLGGKKRAAPIIRVDWTNAFRGEDFPLPATAVKRMMISDAEDALSLGASAAVASFLFGFDDDFESENIRDLSHFARSCQTLFLPFFIDIHPIGERISEENFEESVKLACSFMMELGAEALIIPRCSEETLKFLTDWMKIPILIRLREFIDINELDSLMATNISGVVLTHQIFADAKMSVKLTQFYQNLHKKEVLP